ncbi:peptidyl-dipeptidase Dcp [Sphingomonas kaistensis]|uniref:Peptidyl-dipeptidase Dcp n=1 Tax=Sphingomonas kaistensis TaxID=298708 RepID=A0A7X6BH52_9SPHN|nr:M3 family metallopeptidase [Sphingomonas kaistensis]NJC05737.1 peptidyl-dipeptidase Dcp [Sphingomonas kaistensis]
MTNPLLEQWAGPAGSPDFAAFRAEHFLPAIETGIGLSRAEIAAITDNAAVPDFDNTVAALERSGAVLARVRRVFWMLASAQADEGIHAIEAEVSARLTVWGTEVSQNAALFARVAAVWQIRGNLPAEQARLVDNSYKGFLAGGAALDPAAKRRLAEISERLGALGVTFGQNVLAATNATEIIVDEADAGGIPDDLRAGALAAAAKKGLKGQLLFGLDRGTYEGLLTFADARSVRERVWRAFTGRCQSEPHDNYPIIAEIVALRDEKARLLGYATYADFALEDAMAKTPAAAEGLMDRVWRPGLLQAEKEAAALQQIIDRDGGGFTLAAWDWRYFSDRVRRERYAYDAGAIRSHLSLGKVRAAAFAAAGRLYGLHFTRRPDVPVYHPDVCAWSVDNDDGTPLGLLFTDYLARPEKHGGAWMGSLRVQEKIDAPVRPIVYTVANFTRAEREDDALLSLDEARTLFHEFGHALHALLSDVTYPSLAGTAVARDFVEFPSKLMEHWVASPEALRGFGIPADLADAVARAETFGQGFATVEFLASAIVDLKLHVAQPPPTDIAAFERDTLAALAIPEAIGMRHRLAYFTHVFDGGYASAYYSYLWAEVLDADVFEAFTATGNLFDRELADRLRREVLAQGDARDPMQSFTAFRGREPDEAALLRARCLA